MSEEITAPLQCRVLAVLRECLIQSAEACDGIPADALIVEGLTTKFAFNRERVEKHRATIRDFCSELPVQFEKGDGLSFLLMCQTRDGSQWGESRDCEHLLALALATKQANILPANRQMWRMCPGGVPYVAFCARTATEVH